MHFSKDHSRKPIPESRKHINYYSILPTNLVKQNIYMSIKFVLITECQTFRFYLIQNNKNHTVEKIGF
jgi:hypothetical protein